MEMRSRRKILLLHGVAEDKKEDTSACVIKVLNSNLRIPAISSESISRCHRLGQPVADKPRAILIKLSDLTVKDKVWMAKKNLKGTRITLSEFLTKGRHDVFQAARQRFGVTRCWTNNGVIVVLGPDQTRHRVSSRLELDSIPNPQVVTQAPSAAAVVTGGGKDARSIQIRPKRALKK